MISYNSNIGEILENPVGSDIINKLLLQTGLSIKVLKNPLVSRLKLSTLKKLLKGKFSEGFFDSFINLLNCETDTENPVLDGEITHKWWKEAVFYQIYPRSFYDTNNDGIGDLRGIIEKLDYLKDLGVDALWLSPIYDSPNDDNGYDIRDYRKIMTEFGTMEDFDELLSKAHEKGLKLIMDLVVNHTSDEHEWFVKGLKDPSSKYHNYYIWRDIDGDNPPNNWTSFFAGSAWNRYDEIGQWALHSFSKKQMDLNWESDELRAEVIDMIKWWLDKGVDGFRMDVINLISKREGLPDGDPLIGDMMGVVGIEHDFYGPKLHEYLKEIKKEAFKPYDAFSVGETPGLGLKMARMVTGEERNELDMIFSFDHLESPGKSRYDDYNYDLEYLKKYFLKWQLEYGNNCWPSIFYNNHDNPKMVSKIRSDGMYVEEIEKLLAVMQFTLKGTPFIYQGEEMGLKNYSFDSIDDITDVEAKGYFNRYLETMSSKEAFSKILAGTREHARILLPWNETDDPKVRSQAASESITKAYKELIKIRKDNASLVYGSFKPLRTEKGVFTYQRGDKGDFIIDVNLSEKPSKAYVPSDEYKLIWGADRKGELSPYEARIWGLDLNE